MPKRVTLDTGVARELCHSRPNWVQVFAEMTTDGWSFHLTDIAVAELIDTVERGSVSAAQWNSCIEQLKTFLSDWMPCLPGKRQLFHLCEFEDSEDPNKQRDTEEFRDAYSDAIWRNLQQLGLSPDKRSEVIFEADGQKFRNSVNSSVASSELKAERAKWVSKMSRDPKPDFDFSAEVAEIQNEFDTWATTSGLPLSVRGEILAHVQAEWEMRIASGYSPSGKKRRNDGIDFLLNFAFMWPALLVTLDGGVHSFLRGLASFQATWVYLPDELAQEWKAGTLKEPVWPTTEAESGRREILTPAPHTTGHTDP